jgi:hypothetical protein
MRLVEPGGVTLLESLFKSLLAQFSQSLLAAASGGRTLSECQPQNLRREDDQRTHRGE